MCYRINHSFTCPAGSLSQFIVAEKEADFILATWKNYIYSVGALLQRLARTKLYS
jgi:hypothetical protein